MMAGRERPLPGERFLNVRESEETNMVDENRVEGSAKNIGGKIKEGFGKLTGDSKTEAEGKMDQAEGKVQNTVGGIKDAVKDAFSDRKKV
jgi:uncharacterized protein YjbJ (UPF0337 family)